MNHNYSTDVDTYINVKDLKNRLSVCIGYKPDFGAFYITRWLYAIMFDGAGWIKATAFVIQFSLTPFALSLDFAALLVVGVLWLAKKICEMVITLIFNAISALFSTVIKSYLGTILKLVAILMVVLYCYLDWDSVWYCAHWLFAEGKRLMYNIIQGS